MAWLWVLEFKGRRIGRTIVIVVGVLAFLGSAMALVRPGVDWFIQWQLPSTRMLASTVQINERVSTLDLSSWRPADVKNLQAHVPCNRGIMRVDFNLRKERPGDWFVHRVGTESGIPPRVNVWGRPFVMKEAEVHGNLRQWDIYVRIADDPLATNFDVRIETDFFNGYDDAEPWAGMRLSHPTMKAKLAVIFPADRPASALKKALMVSPESGNKPQELNVAGENITYDYDASGKIRSLAWIPKSTEVDRSYRLQWAWTYP